MFFPTAHGGTRFLNYVWVRLLTAAYRAKRPHAKEVLFDALSLLARGGGERKTLRVWGRLLSMGPRVCILERTISC